MSLAYFPFYPGDWLSSATVQSLSLEEQGAFIRLLAYMWKTSDCTLPLETSTLCRMVTSLDTTLVTRLVTRTMLEFVDENSGEARFTNVRLRDEFNKAHKAYDARAIAANNARQHIKTKQKKPRLKSLDKSLGHNQNQNKEKKLYMEFVLLSDSERD